MKNKFILAIVGGALLTAHTVSASASVAALIERVSAVEVELGSIKEALKKLPVRETVFSVKASSEPAIGESSSSAAPSWQRYDFDYMPYTAVLDIVAAQVEDAINKIKEDRRAGRVLESSREPEFVIIRGELYRYKRGKHIMGRLGERGPDRLESIGYLDANGETFKDFSDLSGSGRLYYKINGNAVEKNVCLAHEARTDVYAREGVLATPK